MSLIELLAQQADVTPSRLRRLADDASKLYKTYTIPKQTGGRQEISQPTPELKSVQRWITRTIIQALPISNAASAYRKGASIKRNAAVHLGSLFTLHLDFVNFFPSFPIDQVYCFFTEGAGLEENDAEFCAKIVSRHGTLTVGAPSSPALTNAMMYSFDEQLLNWCLERRLSYTRYADDINISAKEPFSLETSQDQVTILASHFPYARLEINNKKTAYLSRKYRRSITGINITPDDRLSIGRERKRNIKRLIHLYTLGKLPPEEKQKTAGLIAFAKDVEPSFIRSLEEKYGRHVVSELLGQKDV